MRLHKTQEEFGDKVQIVWKGVPLVVEPNPQRHFSPYYANVWRRASQEPEGLIFRPWESSRPMPSSSLPALLAGLGAERQGPEAFARFHLALFQAFFSECRDISQWEVILSVAEAAGLDASRLAADVKEKSLESALFSNAQVLAEKYGNPGIPVTVFEDGLPLIGAAPLEVYRHALHRWRAIQEGPSRGGSY